MAAAKGISLTSNLAPKLVLLQISLASTLLGCAPWQMGATLHEYQGQVLRVKDNGPGATRLAVESDYDPTVRHFVLQNGGPDYIYVIDAYSLQLIYLEDDRIVLFQRVRLRPTSRATATDGIPDAMTTLFSSADQQRLAESRARRLGTRTTPPGATK